MAERKQAWEERHETISHTEQQNALPLMKRTVRPALMEVHAQVVQGEEVASGMGGTQAVG